ATETGSLSLGGRQRECQTNDCDGRCSDGKAFGRGFDSRQVHFWSKGKCLFLQAFSFFDIFAGIVREIIH
ncbi:MAG TPA: hypothetical protein K8V82_08145, partial [Lachnoclostridium phocaeense]|nr:hypothetical protein [Lachnoclostridium phocaeense]